MSIFSFFDEDNDVNKKEEEQNIDETEEKTKEKDFSVFDIVANINKKTGLLDEEVIEKYYVPYIVNRSFSNSIDTVLLANEMNHLNCNDKLMQYHFFYYSVEKDYHRFGKWFKPEEDDERIEIIKTLYHYSTKKAKEVLPILVLGNKIDSLKRLSLKGGYVYESKRKRRVN